jgi:NAD(P)-dependent dehydrogenase (short-subunit alcohol dehydrogenase family)
MGGVRFDDKVAIITGAGGGLGRSHALLLASLGAKVVVNDLGGNIDGTGTGKAMADMVVEEIVDAGGTAVSSYDAVDSMEGGRNIVKTAIDNFGGVDILVNNAGILIDRSFAKMEEEDWDRVLSVHLKGAYCVTHAAFPVMKENSYGRIVFTASAAGLFGNFGQANYAAAKSAMIGLMNVLKIEGAKYNINVNTIAPMAASRMTENLMPPDVLEKIKPELVSPIVAYLCSEDCGESGGIYSAAGGHFGRISVMEGRGVTFGRHDISVDDIKENFDSINRMEDATYHPSLLDHAGSLLERISKKSTE